MITVTALGLMAALAQAAPCESLRTGSFPNTTITSAQLVAAGPYVAPAPGGPPGGPVAPAAGRGDGAGRGGGRDRKSTRLNSSHSQISYAVFCLKKKNTYFASYLTGGDCVPDD